MPRPKLRTCPFCGGGARLSTIRFTWVNRAGPATAMYVAQCRDRRCDGHIMATYVSAEAAAEAWNRRAEKKGGAE